MEILNRIANRKTEIAVLFIMVYELCFPQVSYAAEAENSLIVPNVTIAAPENDQAYELPLEIYRIKKTYRIPITAYSSTVDQCDSTPCITANGFNLCEHNAEDVIAANFLPFGTKVRMPKLFGDRIFTVQDRMNARYYYRADVWMKTRAAAVKFGLVYTEIEVIE